MARYPRGRIAATPDGGIGSATYTIAATPPGSSTATNRASSPSERMASERPRPLSLLRLPRERREPRLGLDAPPRPDVRLDEVAILRVEEEGVVLDELPDVALVDLDRLPVTARDELEHSRRARAEI